MKTLAIRFLGALLITYFLSRGFRRIALLDRPGVKEFAPHFLSLVVVFLMLFALRYPLFIFHKSQMIIYAVAQLVWLVFDLYRSRIAFWRAPVVVQPTESSAR